MRHFLYCLSITLISFMSLGYTTEDNLSGKASSIVMEAENYEALTPQLINNLKDNATITQFTLHTQFNYTPKAYKNYTEVIFQGLQNKSNLESLTIIGNFDVNLFFQSSRCIGNDFSMMPEDFLNLPHLAFFSHLKSLKIVGNVTGSNRNDRYFLQRFLPVCKNLKLEMINPASYMPALSKSYISHHTSVNLMWIFDQPSWEPYIFEHPINRFYRETNSVKAINVFEVIDGWAKNYPVNVWYDSAFIGEGAVENTYEAINTLCAHATQINFKDIRNLSIVKKHPLIFRSPVPLYFRADLLRVAAAYESLKDEKENSFFLYTDFSVDPLAPEDLLDKTTVENLNTYGIVMARSQRQPYENNFQIIGNNNKNLLKAVEKALIQKSIELADLASLGQILTYYSLPQMVYNCYPDMFKLFYTLEEKATLVKQGKTYKTSLNQEDLDYWFGLIPYEHAWTAAIFNVTDEEVKSLKDSLYIPLTTQVMPESHF